MNILALNDSHEANAAIFVDDELVAAATEERFTRLKMEMGYPKNAVEFCMNFSGLSAEELDVVAFVSENDLPEQYIVNRISTFSVDDFVREQQDYWKPKLLQGEDVDYLDVFRDKMSGDSYDYSSILENWKVWNVETRRKAYQKIRFDRVVEHLGVARDTIRFVHHEKAHAHYGLYGSPIRDRALVITCEGMGDYSNSTVSIYEEGTLKELNSTRENHIGHLYKFVTLLLGMKPTQHEYKVMGLAPYANAKEVEKAYNRAFKDLFKLEGLNIALKHRPSDFYFWFREKLEGCRFDGIAGALQRVVEEVMVDWVRHCCRELDVGKVILSGGVAQNIKACGMIGELDEVDEIYVCPSSGDGSLSIGGGYVVLDELFTQQNRSKEEIKPISNIYLGPEFSQREIDEAIKARDLSSTFSIIENPSEDWVVDRLIENHVVARMSGRVEFGQRALGNRSILANPADQKMIRKLNTQIKFRDFWMPFTPSVLSDFTERYFENPKNLKSPFMTLAFRTTQEFQRLAPAAIHPADDTARPQMLVREANPGYYDLISNFADKTGTGALLNTSLNLHGEPLVCSPDDAIHTFLNSGIDVLLFDDVAVVRSSDE